MDKDLFFIFRTQKFYIQLQLELHRVLIIVWKIKKKKYLQIILRKWF